GRLRLLAQCGRGEGRRAAAAGLRGDAAGPASSASRAASAARPRAARAPRRRPARSVPLQSRYPVCGDDGSPTAALPAPRRQPARPEPRRAAISQRSKGACEQGPSIVTPPKDIWNVTGAQIYLSCEVIGIPTPVLIWNKIIRGQYGVQRMELLPGDRENLAIQTRGGPEKHEVTGWVLISPLSKEDAGEYECHASNAKGEATASAKIHVVETLHEIALTKDDGAEL
uniref:Insulin like growth factor binding protein 7 n=1 Tax=Malurus cyaneus samueli TaxID=2593467 RepID=A0A8C5UHU1_9PASS